MPLIISNLFPHSFSKLALFAFPAGASTNTRNKLDDTRDLKTGHILDRPFAKFFLTKAAHSHAIFTSYYRSLDPIFVLSPKH
jgi:hypothetical protein